MAQPLLPYETWETMYKAHLKALENAKPATDCKSPSISKHYFTGISKFKSTSKTFKKIEDENNILLKRIASVYSGGVCYQIFINILFIISF